MLLILNIITVLDIQFTFLFILLLKNIFPTFRVAHLAEKYKMTAEYSLVQAYRKVSTKCLRLWSSPWASIHLPEHQDTQ